MSRYLYILLFSIILTACQDGSKKKETSSEKEPVKPSTKQSEASEKKSDINEPNGGLYLADGFSALVVVDSVGPSRHIAVNDNGDIYVILTCKITLSFIIRNLN